MRIVIPQSEQVSQTSFTGLLTIRHGHGVSTPHHKDRILNVSRLDTIVPESLPWEHTDEGPE